LKTNPGKLSIATEGPRNLGGMMAEYFMALSGTKMVHVPYSGAAAGLTAAMAGQAEVTMQSATATTPHARAGKLRPIAVTSGNPVPGFENIPTLKSTYPEFDYSGWYMLYAPAGTPADIVARVNRDFDRVMKEPEVAKKLTDLGPVLEGAGTPESLARFTRQELASYARLTKAINFQPE
jgi:tripartite-type tricarboxylate transporter receptor subunit TctC